MRSTTGRRTAVRRALQVLVAALATFAIGMVGAPRANAEPRTVRVGVYENAPKVFTDENGEATGIFIELLEEIAESEEWVLVYEHGSWAEGLQALEQGRIDLMPDVAFSQERDLVYDFHEVPVVENWSTIYAPAGRSIGQLSDLGGERVAVLGGSIQETDFKRLSAGFAQEVTLVPVGSLDEGFGLVQDGEADFAIANNLFGEYSKGKYELDTMPIAFSPVRLHFATAGGRNEDLLSGIDVHLTEWIADSESAYYGVFGRWLALQPSPRIPPYVGWVIGSAAALLLFAGVWVRLLRWQVRERTKELGDAEGRLALALDGAGEGMWEWSPGTGELVWSERCYTMLGYSPGELPMSTEVWTSLVYESDPLAVEASCLDQMRHGDGSFSMEYLVRAKDGMPRWIQSRGKAVEVNDSGEVVRAAGTHCDVTSRKSQEIELREYRMHLEELVEMRTQELDAANSAKSRFLASVSHELRTPLNSIIGFAGILIGGMAGDLNEEQTKQITMIRNSGQRLLALINDVLDISRIEAGVVDLNPQEVELAPLLTDLVCEMKVRADRKGIDLRCEVCDRPVSIVTDPAKLRQILTNLVGNAVKFCDSGSVSIEVADSGDGSMTFSVTDTGPGMSPDELARVFEAFYQIDRMGSPKSEGTGLGLAISRDYATLLGGELTAESELGNGSTFRLRIPQELVTE